MAAPCLWMYHSGTVNYFVVSSCAADSKDLRFLATMTCSVLRKCLPKLPLPVASKENPVQFDIPRVTAMTSGEGVGPEMELGNCTSMSSSRSASQLDEAPVQKLLQPIHSTPTKINGAGLHWQPLPSQSSSASVDGLPTPCTDHGDMEAGGALSRQVEAPASQEDSGGSSTTKAVAFTIGDSSSQLDADLSSFEAFFPELDLVGEANGGPRTTIGVGECGSSFSRSHSCPVLGKLVPPTDSHRPASHQDLSRLQMVSSPSRDFSDVPAIVVPTGGLPGHATESERDLLASAPTAGCYTDGKFAGAPGTPPWVTRSVLQFVEMNLPCTVGLVPIKEPQLLYKKNPKIERCGPECVLSIVCMHTCSYKP